MKPRPRKVNYLEFSEQLLDRVQSDVPHIMGDTYGEACMACLTFRSFALDLNEYHQHRLFQDQVIRRLGDT